MAIILIQDGKVKPNEKLSFLIGLSDSLRTVGFPGRSDGKESAYNAGDIGLIHGSGRSSGEGNTYLLQYSCLENSVNRGAWRATVHGITKSWI